MNKQNDSKDGNDTNNPALNRDPSEWKTGGEPLTAAQRSYVETLAHEAGEEVDEVDSLTKAEASEKIDELQEKTGRGRSN
jgi:hypothetical protein